MSFSMHFFSIFIPFLCLLVNSTCGNRLSGCLEFDSFKHNPEEIFISKITDKYEPPSILNETTESPKETIEYTENVIREITKNLLQPIVNRTEFIYVLKKTVASLNLISNNQTVIDALEPEKAKNISINAYNIVNNLLLRESSWSTFNSFYTSHPSLQSFEGNQITNILHSVAEIMNIKVDSERSFEYHNETLYVRTTRFQYVSKSSIHFTLPIEDNKYPIEVIVPFSSLKMNQSDQFENENQIPATFSVILKEPSYFLQSRLCIAEKTNTNIFALVLSKNTTLVKEFTFRAFHKEELQYGDKSFCSFWDRNPKGPQWSDHPVWTNSPSLTHGCWLDEGESSRTMSVCHCNQTADLAAFIDYRYRWHFTFRKIIDIYFSTSINIVTVILAMILAAKYHIRPRGLEDDPQRFRQNKFFLFQNICLWIVVSNLLVIIGMEFTGEKYRTFCRVTSLLFIFSILCAFMFISLLLFLLFRGTSRSGVFESRTKKQFFTIGVLIPACIVAIAVFAFFTFKLSDFQGEEIYNEFRGEFFCWTVLDKHDYKMNIWFFTFPVTAGCIINGILLTMIFVQVLTRYKRKQKTRRTVLCIAVFSLSFGLHWMFFLLMAKLIRNSKYFSLARFPFNFSNACQGVALFVDQVLQNRKQLLAEFPILKRLSVLNTCFFSWFLSSGLLLLFLYLFYVDLTAPHRN